jgi:hypothetical protein
VLLLLLPSAVVSALVVVEPSPLPSAIPVDAVPDEPFAAPVSSPPVAVGIPVEPSSPNPPDPLASKVQAPASRSHSGAICRRLTRPA